jgi:plastocyanin
MNTLRNLSSRFLATGALLAASTLANAQSVTTVTQINLSFQAQDITINVGDTVRWIHTGGDHTVTEGSDAIVDGSEAFNALLDGPNPIFEQLFDASFLSSNPRAGNVYNYVCLPHFAFNMIGSVTVNGNSAPGSPFCDCSGSNAPCGNSGAVGSGCQNSSGVGALLSATGSANALVDDLTFQGTGIAPNRPALLFFGTSQQNGGLGSPFGDGLRCAGGQIQRLSVQFSTATGDAAWGPGLNSTGIWNAGDTRHFQIWYRDPQGGPCASGFNVSNGYSVTFN